MPSDITGVSLLSGAGQLHLPAGPDLRRPGAGRRDQPRAGQDPGGAARGDAGAAGHRGRHVARAARELHGVRHPEPDRVRGHLPAARGGAGPVPGQGARRAIRRSGWSRASSSGCWAGSRPTCPPSYGIARVADGAGLARLRDAVRRVRVEPSLVAYITAIVRATRERAGAHARRVAARQRGAAQDGPGGGAARRADVRGARRREGARAGGAAAPGRRWRRSSSSRASPPTPRSAASSRRSRRRGDRWCRRAGGSSGAAALALVAPLALVWPAAAGLLPALDLLLAGGAAGRRGAARRRRATLEVAREAPAAFGVGRAGRGALPLAPSRSPAGSRSRCASGCPIRSAAPTTPTRRLAGAAGRGARRAARAHAGPARRRRRAARSPCGHSARSASRGGRDACSCPGRPRSIPTRARRAAPGAAAPGRCAGARPASAPSGGPARAGCSRDSASGCRATRPASSTGRPPPGGASRSRGSTRTSGGSRC